MHETTWLGLAIILLGFKVSNTNVLKARIETPTYNKKGDTNTDGWVQEVKFTENQD